MLAIKPTYKHVDRKDVWRSNGRIQDPTDVRTGCGKGPTKSCLKSIIPLGKARAACETRVRTYIAGGGFKGKWVRKNFKTIPYKHSSHMILSAGKHTLKKDTGNSEKLLM
jgi:hypothetical protein